MIGEFWLKKALMLGKLNVQSLATMIFTATMKAAGNNENVRNKGKAQEAWQALDAEEKQKYRSQAEQNLAKVVGGGGGDGQRQITEWSQVSRQQQDEVRDSEQSYVETEAAPSEGDEGAVMSPLTPESNHEPITQDGYELPVGEGDDDLAFLRSSMRRW